MDGDGERDPSDIPRMKRLLEEKNLDIVSGRRDLTRSKTRKILNLFSTWWINLATGYKLHDTLSGFFFGEYDSFKKLNLKSENFEIETEIILEASKNNLKLQEIPVKVPKLSDSKCRISHMIQINKFFDEWILNFLKEIRIPFYRKITLSFFCFLGMMLSYILE